MRRYKETVKRDLDAGCSISKSCLACPLSYCVLDEPARLGREEAQRKSWEVKSLRSQGLSAKDVASRLGVSTRQVYKYLEEADK